MNQADIVREVEKRTGIKPKLSRTVLKTVGEIIKERVPKGETITLPGIVSIKFGYTPARQKGDVYAGFGGEEKTVEKNTPEKLRVTVNYPGGKPQLLPRKGTVGYKNVVATKQG